MQLQLVHQPGGQRLLGDPDAAGDQHIPAAGGCLGLLDDGLDPVGDEGVAGTAQLLDPLGRPMGMDEDRGVERRIVTPWLLTEVVHHATDDLRAEAIEVPLPDVGVDPFHSAVHPLRLPPALEIEHPAEDRLVHRPELLLVASAGYSVKGDRHAENHCAHGEHPHSAPAGGVCGGAVCAIATHRRIRLPLLDIGSWEICEIVSTCVVRQDGLEHGDQLGLVLRL